MPANAHHTTLLRDAHHQQIVMRLLEIIHQILHHIQEGFGESGWSVLNDRFDRIVARILQAPHTFTMTIMTHGLPWLEKTAVCNRQGTRLSDAMEEDLRATSLGGRVPRTTEVSVFTWQLQLEALIMVIAILLVA